jgi:hypothetical protein
MHIVGYLYEDYHDARTLEHKVSSYYVFTGSSLTRIVHLDMLKDFSCGFWQKGVLMTCYSSKTERLIALKLQFGQCFLDRMISPKWIGRAVSPLPPVHPLQQILHPFDFVFCGYTKDAVPPPSIILPKLARRIQAAAPTASPVTLLNVWTQLGHRYCAGIRTVPLLHACKLFSVGHKTLSHYVPTHYFSFHASSFLRNTTSKSCIFTCSVSVRKQSSLPKASGCIVKKIVVAIGSFVVTLINSN